MADLEQIQARAQAARTLVESVGPARYTLLVPTRHAARVAWLTHGGAAAPVLAERELLEQALIAWDGVTLGMVLGPDQPDAAEPLPWQRGAVPLLLDARPDVETALSLRLARAAEERNASAEATEKNC